MAQSGQGQKTRLREGLAAIERNRLTTPCLVIDPREVARRVFRLGEILPGFRLHYAVKCNPAPSVLHAVAAAGGTFEIASEGELALLESLELLGDDVIFSAPVKATAAIDAAYRRGIRWFAATSGPEVRKILTNAPGASVLVRLAVDDSSARWGLSGQWGVSGEAAVRMLDEAVEAGAAQVGLVFHVGSQNTSSSSWRSALSLAGETMAAFDGRIEMLNIGGGLPVTTPTGDHESLWPEIGAVVADGLATLPYVPAQLVAEPGRAIAAGAGTMYATVISASTEGGVRRVHLDVGAFNGLYESSPQGGALPIRMETFGRDITVLEPTLVGGVSCDADDVIARSAALPVDLAEGEIVAIPDAGAYSLSYAAEFCGLDRPRTVRLIPASPAVAPCDVIEVGEPGFDDACAVEFDVFEASGFLDANGTLDSFRRTDPRSEFLIERSDDGDVVGVARLIRPSGFGFLTLSDMEIWPDRWELLHRLDLTRVVELGTLAPIGRSAPVAMRLVRAAVLRCMELDMTHLVASIDEQLRRTINRRLATPEYGACEAIGPTVDYYGSPTTPILVDLSRAYHAGSVERLEKLATMLRRSDRQRATR